MIRDIKMYLVQTGEASAEPDESGNFPETEDTRIEKHARAYPMKVERMQMLYGGVNQSAMTIRTFSPITESFDHIEVDGNGNRYKVDRRNNQLHFSILEVSRL
jgi:hypothetical protein